MNCIITGRNMKSKYPCWPFDDDSISNPNCMIPQQQSSPER